MFGKPQDEHRWLEQLVGDWRIEQDCRMPDTPPTITTADMTCRMLGGLWLLAESHGSSEEGDWSCVLTLGFDPARDTYVGTFVGSMMTHLWQYTGQRSPDLNQLQLSCTGPALDGSGTAGYRDTLMIVSADEWHFTSEMQAGDAWQLLMKAVHTRC